MFVADTADDIIKKYNELVGKPILPPFLELGSIKAHGHTIQQKI